MKQVRFDFSVENFESEKDKEINNLVKGNIYTYNKSLNDVALSAEELDRIDDFADLKIPLEAYENKSKDKSKYGIIADDIIHKNGVVILDHQKNAAETFLKQLRGFGLLADIVGAGKTYEAGVVLSELAARGKLKSLLVIVPSHLVDTWKEVLEVRFGLGRGALYVSDGELGNIKCDEHNRLLKPILISIENFAKWDESYKEYLFDCIVVDEAHNLCLDGAEYQKSMILLSLLMQTKKKYGNNYCLLLSATPHSGNLDSMFKLWYFIRCKGGNPSDFKAKNDVELSNEFKRERDYYHEVVCRGSKTIMEFIKNVKISEVESRQDYKKLFIKFLNDEKNMTEDDYNKSFKSLDPDVILERKIVFIDEFLNSDTVRNAATSNFDVKANVSKAVANAYHNGVLRTIMVRQSKKEIKGRGNRMIIKNIFYAPTSKLTTGNKNVLDISRDKITVDFDHMYSYDNAVIDYSDLFIKRSDMHDATTNIVKYSNIYKPEGYDTNQALYELLLDIIEDTVDDKNKLIYKKSGTFSFLRKALVKPINESSGVKNYIKPIKYIAPNNVDEKLNDLFRILKYHENNRIVVFFDYEELEIDKTILNTVSDFLKASPFKDRVLFSKSNTVDEIQRIYEEKENTILVCEDKTFTEGFNLQKGNVIVNFTVTPDPLAMSQRIGRVDRFGQANQIFIYSLADLSKIEGFALAYLTAIGIMNSDNNDATIISGSSNEKMIAIQCPKCGKVKMISKEKYEMYSEEEDIAKKISGQILCDCKESSEIVYNGNRYTKMTEINLRNSKCSHCHRVFHRVTRADNILTNAFQTDGRLCFAPVRDKMLLESDNSYEFHCSKICAMKHCKAFMNRHQDCKVLKAYEEDPNVSIEDLMYNQVCEYCKTPCDEKCRPYTFDSSKTSVDLIEECIKCNEKSYCGPYTESSKEKIRPHILKFDTKNWVATCPMCHTKDSLRPVEDSTFEKFIRNSWKFNGDNGEGFVILMNEELDRVNDIKNILDNDEYVKKG